MALFKAVATANAIFKSAREAPLRTSCTENEGLEVQEKIFEEDATAGGCDGA